MDVRWYFTVILICISLKTNDVEHLSMCLLASGIFSLEKYLSIQILCPFLNWVVWTRFSIAIFVKLQSAPAIKRGKFTLTRKIKLFLKIREKCEEKCFRNCGG